VHVVVATAAYLPDEHTEHTVLGSESRSEYPTTQSMHPTSAAVVLLYEPADEYCPLRHAMHGVDALLSWSSSPAAHVTHTDAPDDEYCPETHAMHDAMPTVSWYWPRPHSTHVSIPVVAANMPSAQSMQSCDPAEFWYWPSSHRVHADCTPVKCDVYCPTPQSMHCVEPVAPWYWPYGQFAQSFSDVWPV